MSDSTHEPDRDNGFVSNRDLIALFTSTTGNDALRTSTIDLLGINDERRRDVAFLPGGMLRCRLRRLRDEYNTVRKRGAVARDTFLDAEFDLRAVGWRPKTEDPLPSVANVIQNSMLRYCRRLFGTPETNRYHRICTLKRLNSIKNKQLHRLRYQKARASALLSAGSRSKSLPSTPFSNSNTSRRTLNSMRAELGRMNDEMESLREQLAEKNDPRVTTKENGIFTDRFHMLLIDLIALGVPDSKICDTIRCVAAFLGKELSNYPSLPTIRNDAMSLLALSSKQVQSMIEDTVESGSGITLISDETTKNRHKLQCYMASLSRDAESSQSICIGLHEVHSKAADVSLDTLTDKLSRIELVSSSTSSGAFLSKFVTSVKACMSDRASTQTHFNSLFQDLKRELLPNVVSDWDELSATERESLEVVWQLYCQLHISATATDVVMCSLLGMESESSGLLSECSALTVIKILSAHFSDRGAGKYQQLNQWLEFMGSKGVNAKSATLPSFHGNRFNVSVAIASMVFRFREEFVEYIRKYASEVEALMKAANLLESPVVQSQLRVAGLVDSLITGPIIRLAEHSSHITDTSSYINDILAFLRAASNNPVQFLTGATPQLSTPCTVPIFHIDSLSYQKLISSQSTNYDELTVQRVAAALNNFFSNVFVDFLPGGALHSSSASVRESLKSAPSTSRCVERAFGLVDHYFHRAPNMRMVRREAHLMGRTNDVMKWVHDQPLQVQAEMLADALRKRTEIDGMGRRDREALGVAIRKRMEEKAVQAREKEERNFARKSEVAASIACDFGYWRSSNAMHDALGQLRTKGEKIKALKAQINFRKTILKQPPPRKGIFTISPKGVPVTVERLQGVVGELIEADLRASAGKRVIPDIQGKRVERMVRDRKGTYTMVEGRVKEVCEKEGILYVVIEYSEGDVGEIMLEELEEEVDAGNTFMK